MTSKVLQNPGSQTSITVVREDQDRINTFSRLNNRRHELEDDIAVLENDLLRIADARTDIYMSDENRIALGETFVAVDTDQADAFLERKETELKRDRDALRQELTVVTDRMTKLKGQLYAKFGKSINLEEN